MKLPLACGDRAVGVSPVLRWRDYADRGLIVLIGLPLIAVDSLLSIAKNRGLSPGPCCGRNSRPDQMSGNRYVWTFTGYALH